MIECIWKGYYAIITTSPKGFPTWVFRPSLAERAPAEQVEVLSVEREIVQVLIRVEVKELILPPLLALCPELI